jgi:hypothetical protein
VNQSVIHFNYQTNNIVHCNYVKKCDRRVGIWSTNYTHDPFATELANDILNIALVSSEIPSFGISENLFPAHDSEHQYFLISEILVVGTSVAWSCTISLLVVGTVAKRAKMAAVPGKSTW